MINWVLIAFCLSSSITPIILLIIFIYFDNNFEEMFHRLHTIQMQLEPEREVSNND